MAKDIWGVLRTVGLWMLILGDLGMLTIWALTQNWIWFAVGLGITLWIVGFEVWGSLIGWKQKDGTRKKATISTIYKEYIQMYGWKAYVALFCFLFAMVGLTIHLAFFGGMFGSK